MNINLSKEDLVNLVMGTSPYSYELTTYLEKQLGLGNYTGGFVDKWTWSEHALRQLTEEQLYAVYQKVK